MPYSHVNSDDSKELRALADALVKSRKVVMITGAGISTSCGIPDFRSSEGLYSLMESSHNQDSSPKTSPNKVKGKNLFDANLFRDAEQTRTFYRFISALRAKTCSIRKTSAVHKLIRKLRDNGKLVRCYTQNIDGFEAREELCDKLSRGPGNRRRMEKKAVSTPTSPVSTSPGGDHDGGCEVVPLHGELSTLRCTTCRHQQPWTQQEQTLLGRGQPPACPECEEQDAVRKCVGKRGVRVGSLRPNIVLYGEDHPSTDTISEIRRADLKLRPDLLLVMGTSLKVDGLKMLVREFANAVHAKKNGKVVFVNLTPPAASVWGDVFDAWVDMDCDAWVDEMRRNRPEIWQVQTRMDEKSPMNVLSTPSAKVKMGGCFSSTVQVVVKSDADTRSDLHQASRKRKASNDLLEEEQLPKSKRRRSECTNQPTTMVSKQEESSDTIVLSSKPAATQLSASSKRKLGICDNTLTKPSPVFSRGRGHITIYDEKEVDTAKSPEPTSRSALSASKSPSRQSHSSLLAQKSFRIAQSGSTAPSRALETRPSKHNTTEGVLRPSQGRVTKAKMGRKSRGTSTSNVSRLNKSFKISRGLAKEESVKVLLGVDKENLA